MDQNENLIERLYEAANGFSSEEKATYYAKQVDSLKDVINKYDFRIKNAIKLYNTFEGEDMALKAVKFADIIHKLIQLKTSLAAGESDINYENLNTGPMLESIDQMIQSYSKPFKTEIKEETIVLSYSFIPESPDKEIYLGLLRSEEGNFTLSDKLKDAVPLGIFEIHSKCQPVEVSQNKNKGMVYKIMSPCTYDLFYRRSTNSEEMNHIYQYTTGIAQFGKETQTPSQAREIRISGFDGSLLKFR